MKQTFDLVSHFFALLPLAALGLRIGKPKQFDKPFYRDASLFFFLLATVSVSLWYHSYRVDDPERAVSHSVDLFFSSAIVAITFLLYVDHEFYPTVASLCLIAGLVYWEHDTDSMVPEILRYIVIGLIIAAAVYFFLKERKTNLEDRRFNMKDPYFISFFLTQCLAIIFFLVDTHPYYHSLWHLFAFVSLASVITHSGGNSVKNTMDTKLFYLLGSLPSRLFIAWIFIDWERGDGYYVGLLFLTLSIVMLFGFVKFTDKMSLRRWWTSLIGVNGYFVISMLLFGGWIAEAGWILILCTVVSFALWVMEDFKYFEDRSKYEPVQTKPYPPTLELNNLVF